MAYANDRGYIYFEESTGIITDADYYVKMLLFKVRLMRL